jgi:hypothetical protein
MVYYALCPGLPFPRIIAVGKTYKEVSDKAFALYPFEAGQCASYYITHKQGE